MKYLLQGAETGRAYASHQAASLSHSCSVIANQLYKKSLHVFSRLLWIWCLLLV